MLRPAVRKRAAYNELGVAFPGFRINLLRVCALLLCFLPWPRCFLPFWDLLKPLSRRPFKTRVRWLLT